MSPRSDHRRDNTDLYVSRIKHGTQVRIEADTSITIVGSANARIRGDDAPVGCLPIFFYGILQNQDETPARCKQTIRQILGIRNRYGVVNRLDRLASYTGNLRVQDFGREPSVKHMCSAKGKKGRRIARRSSRDDGREA